MILSAEQELSNAQAVTATAVSTNTIDLGATGTVLGAPAALTRDIGRGQPIPILCQVETAFDTDEPGTISVQIITSATSTLASPTIVAETDALVSSTLTSGYTMSISCLPDKITQRYLGVRYEVTNTVSGGTISAAITMGNQLNTVPGRA